MCPQADSNNRTEERAAAYLEGLMHLAAGSSTSAIKHLHDAAAPDPNSYRYAVYELALAEAYLQAGLYEKGLKLARLAMEARDAGDVRLDLQIDRTRAVLLQARILAKMGVRKESEQLARQFVRLWHQAPVDHPYVQSARKLQNQSR